MSNNAPKRTTLKLRKPCRCSVTPKFVWQADPGYQCWTTKRTCEL